MPDQTVPLPDPGNTDPEQMTEPVHPRDDVYQRLAEVQVGDNAPPADL